MSTRSNGPSRVSAAASAFAVASVSEPANAGSVTCTPVDVDVALESPRDRFAQRVVGGRRSEREHRDARTRALRRELAPPCRPRAGSTGSSRARCRRGAGGRRVELHLLELRDLLHQHRDAHGGSGGKLTTVSGYDTRRRREQSSSTAAGVLSASARARWRAGIPPICSGWCCARSYRAQRPRSGAHRRRRRRLRHASPASRAAT